MTATQLTNANNLQTRRLARVCPAGFTQPQDIFELRIPSLHNLSNEQLTEYEDSLNAFQQGDWQIAKKGFGNLALIDPPSKYLVEYMAKMTSETKSDWMGVITLSK